jgi:hypothetical protein
MTEPASDDGDELDPNLVKNNDRACMWVGRYFYFFATLERSLHRTIRYLFDLKLSQTEMLLANITVRDKVFIVKTAVEFYSRTRVDGWVAGALKTLDTISNEIGSRNLLAHTSFKGIDAGVEFFKVKAKGKFDIPDIVWTEKDFDNKYDLLIELAGSVEQIIADMKNHKAQIRIAEELAKPTVDFSSLGLLAGLSHLVPSNLDAPPLETTAETRPQNPPNSRYTR